MPLDRRITVTMGDVSRDVWAELLQDRVDRGVEIRGVFGLSQRVYRIRWWPELLAGFATGETIRVVDGIPNITHDGQGPGAGQVVSSIGEPDNAGRRRFLDLLMD